VFRTLNYFFKYYAFLRSAVNPEHLQFQSFSGKFCVQTTKEPEKAAGALTKPRNYTVPFLGVCNFQRSCHLKVRQKIRKDSVLMSS